MNRVLLSSMSRPTGLLRPGRVLAVGATRYESSKSDGIFGWFRRGDQEKKPEESPPDTVNEPVNATVTPDTEQASKDVATTDIDNIAWTSDTEPRVPGWMEKLHATSSETDIESINQAVKTAIIAHHRSSEQVGQDWQTVPLRPQRLKYEVIVQAMETCHIHLPNRALTNVVNGGDLAQALYDQAIATTPNMHLPQPARVNHAVARFFEEKVEELPPNLTFIKFDKQAKREVKELVRA
ncbi:hypothetical protein BDF19DRAFT_423097 [Syncephalis fuscata]|nr:hypothetical protein BDF19DRAFT_423097 [Syncephalis fuscata]